MYLILCFILALIILLYILSISKNYYNYELFYAGSCGNEEVYRAINAVSTDICKLNNKLELKIKNPNKYIKMYKWYELQSGSREAVERRNASLSKSELAKQDADSTAAAQQVIARDSKPESLGPEPKTKEGKVVRSVVTNTIDQQTNSMSDAKLRENWINAKTQEFLREEFDNSDDKDDQKAAKILAINTANKLTIAQMRASLKNIQRRNFKATSGQVKAGNLDNDAEVSPDSPSRGPAPGAIPSNATQYMP